MQMAPKNRVTNQQPHQTRMNYPKREDTLKDAALRSLQRKSDKRLKGTGARSYMGSESGITNSFNNSNYNSIKMKDPYDMPQNSILKNTAQGMIRLQLKESNNRLRALQELERRREEQMKKEIEALEMKKIQQEDETQRRISIKKIRLAETGPISTKQSQSFVGNLKGRIVRDTNQQHRFIALVRFLIFSNL